MYTVSGIRSGWNLGATQKQVTVMCCALVCVDR